MLVTIPLKECDFFHCQKKQTFNQIVGGHYVTSEFTLRETSEAWCVCVEKFKYSTEIKIFRKVGYNTEIKIGNIKTIANIINFDSIKGILPGRFLHSMKGMGNI